jgi:hypothetical protein
VPERVIEKIEPGDVFDRLTVLSVRPTFLRCECGKVIKRGIGHLRGGIRSCGCLQWEQNLGMRGVFRDDVINVTQVEDGGKSRTRTYRAECRTCGNVRLLKHESMLKSVYQRRCRSCPRFQKGSPTQAATHGRESGSYPGGGGTKSSRRQATRGEP